MSNQTDREQVLREKLNYEVSGNNRREDVLTIDASVAGDTLKVSGFEKNAREERPVKNYSEIPFNGERIREYTCGIIGLLNRSNQRGKIGNDLLVRLKELGSLLYDELFPPAIKELLAETASPNLIIGIDDQLVQVPWELLFDGTEFLCRRFSMGRTVKTRQPVSTTARVIGRPLKMQVLADPRGDLKAAYEEGIGIRDAIGHDEELLELSLTTTEIKSSYVKAKIRNFDILHYAGHAEHNSDCPEDSGWLLQDGTLSAWEILAMRSPRPMPALVFSNACQTGHSGEWKLGTDYEEKVFGLANAFLLAGVEHYVGTFWEIPDDAGRCFAIAFYQHLVQGATIGGAVREARQSLIARYGEDTIIWAGYMLYGDPGTRYILPETNAEQVDETVRPESVPTLPAPSKHTANTGARRWRFAVFIATALVLAGMVGFLVRPGANGGHPAVVAYSATESDRKQIDELVTALAGRFREGKFEQAVPRDEWSSRPLTLAVMEVRTGAGTGQGGSAGGERFVNLLNRSLQEDQAVTIVERQILERLLTELRLGASALADPATALKLGKIFSAQFIVTGTIMSDTNGQTAILRLIDTETTVIRKMVSAQSAAREIGKELCNDLGQQIREWAKAEFPLRGRIVSVAGKQCAINLGQIHGLKKGARLEVVAPAKKGSDIHVVIGELEVSDVGKDTSTALVIGGGAAVQEKIKVRLKK